MKKDLIISVILITQNDADILEKCLIAINTTLHNLDTNFEILVVDNHSEDNTIDKLRHLHQKIPYLRVLVLSRPYDSEIAATAGFDSCVGDYAILLNLYTDPPIIIPAIYSLLWENNIVIGKHNTDLLNRDLPTRTIIALTKYLSRREYRHSYNYTLGLNRNAINALTRTRRKSRRFDYLSSVIGLQKFVFEFKPKNTYKKRLKQESFIYVFLTILDTTISNSFRPLRLFSLLGIAASVLFLLYIIGISIAELVFGYDLAPKGWISLGSIIAIMFLVLFTLLYFIAEYIIRSVTEARDEPIYFIADEFDKSVIIPNSQKNITK